MMSPMGEELGTPICFVLAGDSGVGKTSLTFRLKNQGENADLERTALTVGVDFAIWTQRESRTSRRLIKPVVWDLAGSMKFAAITTPHFKKAHGIILMYDVTDAATFEHLESDWWPHIEKYAPVDAHGVLKATFLLVGNKKDLVNDERPAAVTEEAARDFMKRHNIDARCETSMLHWSIERDFTPFDAFIELTAARVPTPPANATKRPIVLTKKGHPTSDSDKCYCS
jgi:Ras-related protein Rab-1A